MDNFRLSYFNFCGCLFLRESDFRENTGLHWCSQCIRTKYNVEFRLNVIFLFLDPKLYILTHPSTKCSRWVFVITCLSVVNNFFEHPLLINHKADCNRTLQECTLGEALSKLFKEFESMQNAGCHDNKKSKFGKNFKNILVRNYKA